MLAREGDGTDFRPSRNGDGTVPVAAHSLRACRGAMTRRGRLYAYLGYPVAPRLARMMVWLVDVTDANRRTAVVRLRTACASAAHAAGPVLGLSHFSPPWSICAPRRCARADANVACACCVCGRVGVFFSVYARVHVRYHVCVHASSCHGHVFAHASMRVRVSHFRSPLPSQMQRKLRNYRRTSQSCPVQARCR